MKCQQCQKRPATVYYTHVMNGKKTNIHVCEVCAKENGYMSYPEEGFSLHDLLTGLFHLDTPKVDLQGHSFQQIEEVRCPSCDMSFTEFKRIGKFGCAQCYHTFSDRLDPVFSRVHSGNTRHIGKIPKRKEGHLHLKKQLEDYRQQLKTLIENEAFEKAAIVRDNIKELEQKIRSKEAGDNDEL